MLRDSPLLLVLDLDETVLHVDEENKLKQPNSYSVFYRKEIYDFINFLRKWFKRDNLFLILWSAADDAYVNELLFRMSLIGHFDAIFARTDCKKCEEEFGVYKSLSYLYGKSNIEKWIKKKTMDNCSGPIVFAIVDDKVDENTSSDDPYTFSFQITPITLNNLFFDTYDGSLFAVSESLYEFGFKLLYECIFKKQSFFSIPTETSHKEVKFEIISS